MKVLLEMTPKHEGKMFPVQNQIFHLAFSSHSILLSHEYRPTKIFAIFKSNFHTPSLGNPHITILTSVNLFNNKANFKGQDTFDHLNLQSRLKVLNA